MKNLKSKKSDSFQKQLSKFKNLLIGSKTAKLANMGLIAISILFIFKSEQNLMVIASLVIGISVLVLYMNLFLSLKDIKQKSYTTKSLFASILKFKDYMQKRKRFEMIYISIWFLSLSPFVYLRSGSALETILEIGIYLTATALLGMLAFKNVQKQIRNLESEVLSNMNLVNNQ